MTKTAADLIADALDPIKLRILVFGPQVKHPSADERTKNLQGKRVEIRQSLERGGHDVKYAEDLVDPSIDGPYSNPVLQEILLMAEYDLIIVLVGSPGSIVEATIIGTKPRLAQKSALYLDRDHVDGLAGQTCALARELGAYFHAYDYPADLTDCHLLTSVVNRVATVKLGKYLL